MPLPDLRPRSPALDLLGEPVGDVRPCSVSRSRFRTPRQHECPTSSPTWSASSIGPMGMPKASAAASISSGLMPSSNAQESFHQVGRQCPVDQKARSAFHRQGQFVDVVDEAERPVSSRLWSRRVVGDDLDQRHLGDRIEEMDADEPRRARLRPLCKLSPAGCSTYWWREWRCPSCAPRPRENTVCLIVFVFRHRLDDQIRAGPCRHRRDRGLSRSSAARPFPGQV